MRGLGDRIGLKVIFRRAGMLLGLSVLAFSACGDPQPTSRPAQEQKEKAATTRPSRSAREGWAPAEDDSAGTVPGRTHFVQPKETLYSISRLYYGSERHWRRIWLANRKRLDDPNNLPVGMKLIIPP